MAMDFRTIGDRIATEAFDEQKVEGDAFVLAHPITNLPTEVEGTAFAQLMARIMGTAIAEHVMGYGGQVTTAPNTGVGLDLQMPCCVYQVSPDDDAFITIWVKTGESPTAWRDWLARGDWGHINYNPSSTGGPGLERDPFTIVWQDSTSGTTRPVALWTKSNVSKFQWSKIWPVTVPAADDHLVKARDSDATAVGGLMDKTADSPTVTRELITDGGVEKVRFNAIPTTPEVGGSWLYTGSIQAATLLDPVVSFVKTVNGSGWGEGTGAMWDVLPNGDYQHKAVGALLGIGSAGGETFTLAQGDRVYAWNWRFDGLDNTVHGGICTVVTLGDASAKAVLRKTTDTIQTGSTFKVVGSGAQYENWYWEIDPDPTNLYPLSYKPDYVSTTTYNLLTSSQVARAGTTTRETSVTIPGGTSGGTMFAIPYFEMLDGLGVTTMPKGVVNWKITAYVVSDDPAATIFIRAFLTTDQGVLENFGYADTPPIHGTSATVLKCQGTISADRDVDPTDKLGAVFYGYSSSASAVTIRLVYNDAGHQTCVQTPLIAASGGGTFDHQLLTMASRGFESGEESDAVAYRHPMRAIAPGRIQTPVNSTVTTSSGLFAVPLNSNVVVLDGTEDLLGCSTAGWTGPGWIEVHVLHQRKILRSQTVGIGYAPFLWGSVDTGYGADYNEIVALDGSVFGFRLIGGTWKLTYSMNV